MIDLKKYGISVPTDRPKLITILGDAGTGKTSTACSFPKPIVMRAEDGLQAIPEKLRPPAFPVIKSPDDVWGQLSTLVQEQHNFETLVIDSVTALERLFIQHVIDNDPKQPKSINQAMGGYGAGLSAVATMHHRVRKACGLLVDKGMNVAFIAHADTETIEPPDSDPYTRYTLRLGKKSQAPYVDDVDLVGFLRLVQFLKGDGERKKAISSGAREIVCHAAAANISKNRFGITEPLNVTMGKNPLSEYVK